MKTLNLFALVLAFFVHQQVLAGDQPGLRAKVTTFPAAMNFDAVTSDLKGHAVKTSNGFEAKDVRINLTRIKTDKELRDKHTKEYLQTSKYPEVILVSAKGQGGKGVGRIKLKGIEKPIAGTYSLLDGGKLIKAEFPVKLSDFGITGIKYMGLGVNDVVNVEVVVPVKDK